ncbi:ESPR-type extended signal peptide-containing protein [Burkholderia glumae]|uniref:ESPR-type extended signal peptide-containing protein n=1 Tax=Burkholderia glumae TaxID=337 RepID=UPI001297DA23|nr:ESPR-type extended signal peptide-containing protein [Burkholderia glumae]MCM2551152.1 YadA-like family protein [Burkholderia glumae]NVE25920.1 YadA-like family protein [Burkholderia glumae]QGA39943.1 hypothetical protein GAS19_20300 [Burkholderia glumae]QHP93608.1 hypothetical protein EXE55_22240 [Burkholderia glumae]QKM51292.1 Autotransporter adhesin UpaG [Burkholderia glumae]
MNRAYRSIWNEALGAWVAASELCSTQGKANKSSIPKVGRVSARIPLVFALGFVLGESAMANNLAVGDDAKNMIGYAVSRTKNGYETLAGGDDTNANTAVGTSATANGGRSTAIGDTATATGFHSVAIGADSKATGNGSVAVGNDSTDDAQSNVFSVGNRETQRRIINIAPGDVSSTSTDAINGSQLYSLSTSTSTGLSSAISSIGSLSTSISTSIGSLSTGLSTTNNYIASLSSGVTNIDNTLNELSTAINNNTTRSLSSGGYAADMSRPAAQAPSVTAGSNSVALGQGSNDDGRSNVVSVGSASQQRQLTNVAPGTQGTDAVNLNQLSALSTSMSQSFAGQQNQINTLGTQITQTQQALRQTDTMARQGIAAATALTMLPQVEPGKTINVAVGVARFAGQSGMAFGASAHVTTNGILKLGIGVSGQNKTYGVGYGYSW